MKLWWVPLAERDFLPNEPPKRGGGRSRPANGTYLPKPSRRLKGQYRHGLSAIGKRKLARIRDAGAGDGEALPNEVAVFLPERLVSQALGHANQAFDDSFQQRSALGGRGQVGAPSVALLGSLAHVAADKEAL